MDKRNEKTRIIAFNGTGNPTLLEVKTEELEKKLLFLEAMGYLFEVINEGFFKTFSKDGKLCLEPTKLYDEE